MSKSWSQGSTTRWRKLRAQILANNEATNQGRCTARIAGVCTGVANEVHHTMGREVTGDDPRYLRAVCKACNGDIGKPGRKNPAPKRISSW